jgi:hypothetical protein
MKKILVLAFAATWLIACNDNEQGTINEDTRDNSTVTEPAPTAPVATDNNVYTPAEGDVSYRERKVMVMRNGQWVEAEEDVKLDNGVVVYRTGKVKKDDKETELEEGVVINREGNFFDRTGRAMENAWDETKKGVKKAGKEIEKGANKAGDEVEKRVDDDDYDNK